MHLLTHIAPYEKDAYLDALDDNNVERSDAYPIIRGRLSKINGHEAKKVAQGRKGTDVLRRDKFHLCYEVPGHNLLLKAVGRHRRVSVESDVAEKT